MFERFGVAFWNDLPCGELRRLGHRADELGFDSVWLAESYHYRSIPPIAAAIGCDTQRIRIGLGVLPTHTRHPGLVAMEAATLDELTGGRMILGLGAAIKAAALHGVEAGPISAMRDTVAIVRGLLAGERVTYRGRAWSIANAALSFPARAGMPLYIGTYPYSPQMLKLSGGLADGVVLVWCSPEWVRRAGEMVAEGAHQAGRDPAAVDMAAYLVMSVDPDPAKARAACKPLIASYAPRPVQWRQAGLVAAEDIEPVLSAFDRGGLAAATAAVSDALVEKLAIAGDPAHCRDRLREYESAGLRLPIAYQVLGPDPFLAMDLIAREFLRGPGRASLAPEPTRAPRP
jgi:5,10-methylenetetrahydromethanopterin reductase